MLKYVQKNNPRKHLTNKKKTDTIVDERLDKEKDNGIERKQCNNISAA